MVASGSAGASTVEAALGIATLVVVLVLCLAGVTTLSMQVRCVDAAREAARWLPAVTNGRRRMHCAPDRARWGAGPGVPRRRLSCRQWWWRIQSCCPEWTLPPRRCRRPSRGDDRGSATVVAVAMVAVLLCVTGAGAYLGSVLVARHRAQSAADLAALAAAARLPSGIAAACADAVLVAREMRVTDPRCEVDGLDVVVTVEVAVFFGGAARAAARAGPQILSRLRQSSFGEFVTGGQSQRDQSGEGVRFDFHPVHGHMHRHPIVVEPPHPQYPAGRSVDEFLCHGGYHVFVVGMDPRSVRVRTAPVVERAGLVEPFQQAPIVEVDQRSVDSGLRQPAQDPVRQIVRRYHRAI
jgi:secretion/DNA translocation related TadE-like protein